MVKRRNFRVGDRVRVPAFNVHDTGTLIEYHSWHNRTQWVFRNDNPFYQDIYVARKDIELLEPAPPPTKKVKVTGEPSWEI